MNITKRQLLKIIQEELMLEQEEAVKPKLKSDVETISKKMGKVSGMDKLMGRINTREEFEQIMITLVDQASVNVGLNDVLQGLRNVLKVKSGSK